MATFIFLTQLDALSIAQFASVVCEHIGVIFIYITRSSGLSYRLKVFM